MITLSIDVTLIDKNRLKEITRKNGKQAKFLDLVLIDTPNSEYGQYIVKQQVTKEERAARIEMPILGNGKLLAVGNPPAQRQAAPKAGTSKTSPIAPDDFNPPF